MAKRYFSFEKARKIVHTLNIKSKTEWTNYCKSENKPDNIPNDPYYWYCDNGWISWGDWLGTNTIAPQNNVFLPFEEARKFVRNLNLKTLYEWQEYCKSGNKPHNIPSDPSKKYKDRGWVSCGDPNKTYKINGWVSWGDWLGTFTVASHKNKNVVYLPFEEARDFVRKLKLKTQKEWRVYCKSGNKPDNIPNTYKVYKDKGWVSLSDWLGNNKNGKNKNFLSFDEARKIVWNLKLKTKNDWDYLCISGKRPDNIPSNPDKIYKDMGWISLGDWLGTIHNK